MTSLPVLGVVGVLADGQKQLLALELCSVGSMNGLLGEGGAEDGRGGRGT